MIWAEMSYNRRYNNLSFSDRLTTMPEDLGEYFAEGEELDESDQPDTHLFRGYQLLLRG